jgi:hypothetical protein
MASARVAKSADAKDSKSSRSLYEDFLQNTINNDISSLEIFYNSPEHPISAGGGHKIGHNF